MKLVDFLIKMRCAFIAKTGANPRFDQVREGMPKLKTQHITPKLIYAAKTDDEIILKLSKKEWIVLRSDGTYFIGERKFAPPEKKA